MNESHTYVFVLLSVGLALKNGYWHVLHTLFENIVRHLPIFFLLFLDYITIT